MAAKLSARFEVQRRDAGLDCAIASDGTSRSTTCWPIIAPAGILDLMKNEVTRILGAIEAGNPQAAAGLLPLVYEELRKLAAAHMANEASGHTLSATALVHEAYLRLVGDQQFDNRGHFFAAASEAMRRTCWSTMLATVSGCGEAVLRGGGRSSTSTPWLGSTLRPTTCSTSTPPFPGLSEKTPRRLPGQAPYVRRTDPGRSGDRVGGGPSDRRPRLGVRTRLAFSAAFGEFMSHGGARRSMTMRRPYSGPRS